MKVTSKKTGTVYALKVLSRNQIKNLELEDQLRNEIRILASCDHPNINKLYCVFEESGYIFLILQYAGEGTLFEKLKKHKKFSEEGNHFADWWIQM
jgi:serine/threonine protein kinase